MDTRLRWVTVDCGAFVATACIKKDGDVDTGVLTENTTRGRCKAWKGVVGSLDISTIASCVDHGHGCWKAM